MKETSRFYSSLGLLVILNAIVKPVWIFAIDRQVQNEVGAAAYGGYFSVFNLSVVLSFLLDWGLTNFYNRQLAAKDAQLTANAGSFIFLKLFFAIIYAVFISIVAYLSGIERWDIIIYIILIQVLTSMFVFLRAIVTAQQWFRTDAWLSVLDKLLMLILCGVFLYIPSLSEIFTVEKFLLLQTISTALAMLVTFAILLARKYHFSFQHLWPGKHIIKASLPFAFIILLMSFHARIDGFLLDRLRGPEEAGKYAAAYRLLDAAKMAGYLFASFLLPYIARHKNDIKNIESVILNVRHMQLVFSITVVCIVVLQASWLQNVLYHHDDLSSIKVMAWCLPALIGFSLVQVYGTVMTATGHIVAFSYITTVSVVINLAVNVLFIPTHGAKASCQAAIISQGFCGIATMLFVKRKSGIRFDLRSFLIYIFIAGLACGFLYACNSWQVNKLLTIIITGVIALAMLWLTKLVDLKKWINFAEA